MIAAHAPSEAGGIDWRRLATDRNVSPVVARGLWERARAAAHDDLAEAEHAYLRMLEEAETADATHEPGRETLVGSTPGARDAASLGPGKWTRVLLEDQKAGGPGAPAKRKPEGAAHPQGAAQPQPGAEPVKHASPEELRDQLVGVAQAGKNAAALLAAADPATIIEALRELRDTAGPGVLQTLMSVAGGAIERILGHRLPDPQAHTGPIGERVQFAVDDETHTQYVDDDGVPMMASTPKPVKAKVDEWRTAAATQPPQMQQRVAPELARASSLATTATDQARKAKAGDPAAKAALPATQRALGSSLASVSRQIGAEPAKKPAPLPATAPAAPAPVASTAGHPTPGPAPASPTAAVPGSAAATKATGPKAPEPTAPRPPPDPAAIKAADELLHNVFHTCGAKLPHDLGALAPQGRIDQSSKPAADLRRQYYPSFDSLKPAMSSVAAEKATQLDHEVGLESGAEGLPVKFKGDVLAAFHADTYNTAASFEALFNEVARRGYMMKGKPLLAEDFNAAVPADHSLARVINTDSAFSRYLDKAEAERAWGKDHPGAAPTTDELTAYILQKAKADASGTIKKFVLPTLVEFPSWLFPEPDIKHDAVFSQYCDLLALYANWYPKGHLRMVVKRTAVTDKVAKGGLRKPTVFDGTLSPLWLQRDNRDRNWGKTGGGLREALMKIEWADIDHAKWVLVEIDPKYQAVLDAQAATKAKQATPADAKLIAEHEKSMVVQTEKAQEAEHVHSRPDEKDPAKPIIVSTTMAGAAHTLKADPAIGKVELHSVPGGAVEKLQSVVDLVGPEARGKATNALAKATAAAGIVTEPTLKSGAKTADRPHAVQRLDDKIKELAIAVRSFGDAAKLTDAHPDVVHRVRAEEELRKQRIAQARLTPPTQAQAPGGTAPNPAIKQPPPPVASAPTPATPKLVAGGDASAHHEATEPSAGTHAPAPTSPAPAPATATTPAATTTAAPAAAATAAAPAAPTIEGFNAAVAVNNRAEADRIWGLLPDAQKLSLDFPAAIQAISHFGTRGLSYIIEGSLGMGDPALPAAILAKMDSDPAGWWKALDARNQWDGFLGVAPKRPTIADAQARTLGKAIDAGAPNVHGVFQKVYPDLHDSGLPASSGFHCVAWTDDKVKRLYSVLVGWAPVAHVQSATNGFFLCDQRDGEDLSYAAFGGGYLIMPAVVGTHDGHDMVGGTPVKRQAAGRGATPDVADTSATSSRAHWDISALHEVGHGVGEASGSNAWAITHTAWQTATLDPLFTPPVAPPPAAAATATAPAMTATTPAPAPTAPTATAPAATASGPPPMPTAAAGPPAPLSNDEAKNYMIAAISKPKAAKAYPPRFASELEVVNEINARFNNSQLYHYYQARLRSKDDYDAVTSGHNAQGGYIYAYLERFGDVCKYKEEFFNNKVSFYSVSSPQEWFAESYAQYYRTEKRGTGLDSATITQMASLDSMHWDPARGALAPSSPSNTGNAGDSSTASGAGKVPAPTAGTGAGTAATPPPAPGADVLPLGLKPVSLKI